MPKSIEEVPPIDRIPVVGYMGHKAVYRPPRREGISLVIQSSLHLNQEKFVSHKNKYWSIW